MWCNRISKFSNNLIMTVLCIGLFFANGPDCRAEDNKVPEETQKSGAEFDIYGFVMMDAGYDFNQMDPDWFDTVRPTKMPSFEKEFGTDGNAYFSVRQTRFGVRGNVPTELGDLKTIFEFEMFGVGADAGQTTIRLRHAYGELGQFGAGQYWSPFMDIDVFPNSLEYWGPPGMVFFRNIQFRWMPIKGDTRLTLALERPGASGDRGLYDQELRLEDLEPRFAMPDISGEFRYGGDWGYVEIAGILRRIEWEDTAPDEVDLSGTAVGWGVNFSSNLKLAPDKVAKLQVVYGEAIENYMNDATVDIGIETDPDNPALPLRGEALPVLGLVAFYDHAWNEKFSSSFGYSLHRIWNTLGQSPDAFKRGQYALANLLYYPVKDVMIGGQFQYGRRDNHSDGFSSNDYRIHFSFRYDFSIKLGPFAASTN